MPVAAIDQIMYTLNAVIFEQARAAGLTISPEEQQTNFAELERLMDKADRRITEAGRRAARDAGEEWAAKVDAALEAGEDWQAIPFKLPPSFATELVAALWDVWLEGQAQAGDELQRLQLARAAEASGMAARGQLYLWHTEAWRRSGALVVKFAGGDVRRDVNLGNQWAKKWYDAYGQTLSDNLAKYIGEDAVKVVLEHVAKGTIRTKLTAALAEQFPNFGAVRSQIIARTEGNKALNWGRRHEFDRSKVLQGYRYSAIIDRRTTHICQSLHGTTWAAGDPHLNSITPPNHFQCRSVLVPKSIYAAWVDQKPPGWDGKLDNVVWMKGWTPREMKVFGRFTDTAWIPPAPPAPKKGRAPRKKAAGGA